MPVASGRPIPITRLQNDAPRAARRDGALLLATLIILAAGAKAILFDTLDPDCFWHLRVAQTIVDSMKQVGFWHGLHPIVDDLSFNSIRTPWVPYSWLAELAMKAVWDTAGWRGAIAVQALVVASWAALILVACRELVIQSDPWPRDAGLRCCIAGAGGLFLSLPYLSFRPVTFAWLLIAAVAVLALRDRRRPTPWVWAAVPIAAICANVHLLAWTCTLWPIGLLIEDAWTEKPWRRHLILTLLVAGASVATPLLPGVIGSAWAYQFQDAMVRRSGIAEFQSVFRGTMGIVWAVLAVALVAGSWLRRGQMGIAPLIWLLGATALMARLGKFAPLYALAAAPVAAALVTHLADGVLARPATHAVLAMVLAGVIARMAIGFPRPATDLAVWLNRHGPDTPGYPCAAADFVSKLPGSIPQSSAGGRIINDFNWGGYLAWRLGPRYRVFMDGRTQLYTQAFWEKTLLADPRQCAAVVASTEADAAILPLKRTDWRDALLAHGWRLAYQDDRAMVLLPAGSGGAARTE